MNKIYMNLCDHIELYKLSDKILCSDIEAYDEHKEFNFVYDKLWVSNSQNIPCGPMGIYPTQYPVIFKPIINLYGFSKGFRIIYNKNQYKQYQADGHFWQPYFKGKHICCDIILDYGNIVFSSALRSYAGKYGSFKLHHTTDYIITPKIKKWVKTYLSEYRGCINLEIIDNNIIECHLRLNGDFNLYNQYFSRQLSEFMEKKTNKITYEIPFIYIFPVFVDSSHVSNITHKNKILKLLNKSKSIVKSFGFDDYNPIFDTTLVRFLLFDTYHFYEGLKLQTIIKSILLV
jgi:hypothetical protein